MKRILACLDTSPGAAGVHRAAMEIAEATGAKVQLFRVIDNAGESNVPNHKLVTSAEAALDDVSKNDPPARSAGSAAVTNPSAWKAICKAAREQHADLIVIGAHAHGALARALGTTAADVVNHADQSVLVVRPARSR